MNQEQLEATYQEDIFQIKPKPIVVINERWEKLGDKERELLTKIIAALRMSLDAITIVSQPTLKISSFLGKTKRLIYFGELPAGVAYYEVLESGEISFVCSENLSQLIDNEEARKQLWQSLRKLFSL
jgi:DNA polymerase III psi subunit